MSGSKIHMQVLKGSHVKRNIGIPVIGGKSWLGGVSYIELLFKALVLLPEAERPRLFLIVPQEHLDDFGFHSHLVGFADGIIFLGEDAVSARTAMPLEFTQCRDFAELAKVIDFYFPVNFGVVTELPSASWIPDFQHLHLPRYFSPEEIWGRNRCIDEIASKAVMVVLSSYDAAKDFKGHFHCSAPQRVLQFHAIPDDEWYSGNPVNVQKKYALPDFFLLCSNQFWAHKNHIVLFESLSLLRLQGVTVHCVCTGATQDYRNEGFFSAIRKRLVELGIEDLVHILGTVPRNDQIQLMRRSAAVVQPSLFEGWSTVVEDARALGKTVFLSDLDVNLEQAPNYAVFFARSDPADLASKLKNFLPLLVEGPNRPRELAAQQAAYTLTSEYARQLCAIAEETISAFKSQKQHDPGIKPLSHNAALGNELYAPPCYPAFEECYFYHTMELPGYGVINGNWDLRPGVDDYLGYVDFRGKRVLEVGTANGFLCFEMEKRGADVVGYDLSDKYDWDIVPYGGGQKLDETIQVRKGTIRKLNNAWWFSHHILQSKARVVYGTVYTIPKAIGMVHIATFGSILLHLRDPFLALQRAAVITSETIIVTDLLSDGADLLTFLPDAATQDKSDTWWGFTPEIICKMLAVLGFTSFKVLKHTQLYEGRSVNLFTVVGSRN